MPPTSPHFASPAWGRPFVLAALAAAACLSSLPAQADVLARIKSGEPLRLAHRESSVPFSYVLPGAAAGAPPVGYAVDICLQLAEAVRKATGMAKMPVQWLLVTPANRIDMIAQGKADLECGSTTNNAERRQRVDFTVPHLIVGARLLVKAGNEVDQLRDLRGKTVVSTRGTTPMKVLQQNNREHMLGLNIVEAPDHEQAVKMVEAGQAEAFVMDDVLLVGLASGRADPKALKVTGRLLTTEPLAVMLPKDDTAFKTVIDAEMKRLVRDGDIYKLYDRWFLSPIPPNGRALELPLNYLTKDFWKYPTDKVPF